MELPDADTILIFYRCCGRAKPRISGMEVAHLPFSKAICRRVASILQIHGSIARVINRSSRATFMTSQVKCGAMGAPVLCELFPKCDMASWNHDADVPTVYNCRSSADLGNDLALSVTYFPQAGTTKAVLYGCDDSTRDTFQNRLSLCESMVYHPLTLPMIFADVERERAFNKVKPLVKRLVEKAVSISKAAPLSSPSLKTLRSNSTGSDQSQMRAESPEDLMKLWLQVSRLRGGLEVWKAQLEKMLSHCQTLTFERPPSVHDPSSGVGLTGRDSVRMQFDVQESQDLTEAGERIQHRLIELIGEYDEKIRECAIIIDGMVLATQLVRSSPLQYLSKPPPPPKKKKKKKREKKRKTQFT